MTYPQPSNQPYPPQFPPPQRPKSKTGRTVAITLASVFGGLVLLAGGCAVIVGSAIDDTSSTTESAPKKPVQDEPAQTEPTEKSADEQFEDLLEENEKNREKLDEQVREEAKKDGQFHDGDYVIGEDIPAGTYTTDGAKSGLFEVCMVSTEPTGDKFPQLKSANADERIIITLTKADGVVSISGCEPLTARK